jgi:regulator of cell morphogenesis and NO signaling
MNPTPTTTVGELAARFPQTIRVFQRMRVEFCCDGSRTLGELCQERELSFDELATALASAVAAATPPLADWTTRPLSELTGHIVEAFHEPCRQELPRLREMAVKVQRHTDSYAHILAVVRYKLDRFTADLDSHMSTAEDELFPLISRAEAAGAREVDRAVFARLRGRLEIEHANAGQVLQTLRHATHGYEPPPNSCSSVRHLYHGLRELEQLMRLHVHLENNILFPRAAALLSDADSVRPS